MNFFTSCWVTGVPGFYDLVKLNGVFFQIKLVIVVKLCEFKNARNNCDYDVFPNSKHFIQMPFRTMSQILFNIFEDLKHLCVFLSQILSFAFYKVVNVFMEIVDYFSEALHPIGTILYY